MLPWLGRRSETAKRIEAEADVLVREHGKQAYSIARRREREASSLPMAREWKRIALAAARMTHKRVGLDTGTRLALDAGVVPGHVATEGEQPHFYDPRAQLEELERILRDR